MCLHSSFRFSGVRLGIGNLIKHALTFKFTILGRSPWNRTFIMVVSLVFASEPVFYKIMFTYSNFNVSWNHNFQNISHLSTFCFSGVHLGIKAGYIISFKVKFSNRGCSPWNQNFVMSCYMSTPSILCFSGARFGFRIL